MRAVRIALPLVSQAVVPSPAYQQYVLGQLAEGGTDPITGTALPAQPNEDCVLSVDVQALYSNTAGTPVPVSSCPLDASGAMLPGTQTSGNLFNGSGCANQRQESLTNSDSENLIVVKIDHTIDTNNSVWYRFQQDTGLQAAYTDPINSIFNSYSPQPQYTLVAGYTHLFSPNLVNQFNPGASWYSSIFEPNNFAQVQQTFPIVLAAGTNNAPFTTIGGNDNTYPQGRKVTQWQINDNLIWTRGKNTYKFGVNTRRIDVSDYDLGEGSVPTVVYNDLAQFTYGAAYTASQTFPISLKERVAAGNLDLYAMDTYKPTSRATLTAGVRATWNTNPVNQQRLFARPAGSFLDISHQIKPAARSGDSNQGARALSGNAAVGLAAARCGGLPGDSRDRAACRVRRLQRHHSGADCRPCRDQCSLLADLCRRHRRAGGRRGDCAGRDRQRGRCDQQCRPELSVGLQRGCGALRRHCRGRADMPAGREHEYFSQRHAEDALLLPI